MTNPNRETFEDFITLPTLLTSTPTLTLTNLVDLFKKFKMRIAGAIKMLC